MSILSKPLKITACGAAISNLARGAAQALAPQHGSPCTISNASKQNKLSH